MLDGKPVKKLSPPALLNFKTTVSNLSDLMIRPQVKETFIVFDHY